MQLLPASSGFLSDVSHGFFSADACDLLRETSQGPSGRLLLFGSGLGSDTEADLQCQSPFLLPVHNLRDCTLRPVIR